MRSTLVATVLALAAFVSVPAFAAPAQATAPAIAQRADGAGHGAKHFPMPGAEFKAKIDARQAKGRTRMEARAAKLTPEQAKELRARFDATTAKVNAEVAKAVADGTVTKEEAQAVRAANPHHGKHGHHGKKHGARTK